MNDDQISIASDYSKQTSPTERSSRDNHRLFPVSTYIEPPPQTIKSDIKLNLHQNQQQPQQQQQQQQSFK